MVCDNITESQCHTHRNIPSRESNQDIKPFWSPGCQCRTVVTRGLLKRASTTLKQKIVKDCPTPAKTKNIEFIIKFQFGSRVIFAYTSDFFQTPSCMYSNPGYGLTFPSTQYFPDKHLILTLHCLHILDLNLIEGKCLECALCQH